MRIFRGIVESPTAPSTDMVWIHNKEIRYYNNGTWELLNEKPSMPKLSEIPKYDSPIILIEGSSKSVKESNLNTLKETQGTFLVNIKNGYGVGTWSSTSGGQAHIVTAYGNTLYYTLTAAGGVSKAVETPDLYLEYLNAGGKKSSSQFIKKLVDLIG